MLSCHHEIIKKNSADVRKHVFLFLVRRDVKSVLQDLSIWVPLQDNEQFQQRTQDRLQVIYTWYILNGFYDSLAISFFKSQLFCRRVKKKILKHNLKPVLRASFLTIKLMAQF